MSREFEPYAALSVVYDSVSNVAAKKAAVLQLMQAVHKAIKISGYLIWRQARGMLRCYWQLRVLKLSELTVHKPC